MEDSPLRIRPSQEKKLEDIEVGVPPKATWPDHSTVRAQVDESLPCTGGSNKIFGAPLSNMSRQPRITEHLRKASSNHKGKDQNKEKRNSNLWERDIIKG